MKLYRAIYRENEPDERKLDLYAPSPSSSATLSAAELSAQGTLVRVYENPDW